MSDVASSRLPLPLRFAIRELRAGLRGFYVLVLCIALGVMAIAGIGSVADSLAGGLAREGRDGTVLRRGELQRGERAGAELLDREHADAGEGQRHL